MTDAREEDDSWAEEVDHDAPTRTAPENAPEPATTWSDLRPAVLVLGLLAAASLALGIVALQRSGLVGTIGAVFFLSSATCLLFIILRGVIRLARTGTAGRSH
jgi:hypothetical protein